MRRQQFFAVVLFAPFAIYGQPGWTQFSNSQHFVAAQNGWYFSGAANSKKLEGQSGPVFGHPLSANEVRNTTQTLGDGSHISHSETDKFYRDGQGRMRTETETGAIIFDPVAGYTYNLTFAGKRYTKEPIRSNALVTIAASGHESRISNSYSSHTTSESRTSSTSGDNNWRPVTTGGFGSNGVTEDLPPQILNGVNAKGSRVIITIPQGAIGNDRELKVVNERWYSDDLKLLLKTINNDPRFGVTTYELQNIVQGEPVAQLFQVPADYTEGH